MSEVEEIEVLESSKAMDEPLMNLKKKLEATNWSNWRSERPTIFRVHEQIREVDREAYEPMNISFGPYHRGKKHLANMEKLKWLYLKKFLTRNPELRVEDCVREIRKNELQARRAYSEEIKMDRDEFVEMMLLDGCFIVEMILALYAPNDKHEKVTGDEQFEDPIRGTIWAEQSVVQDMVMLENQLPFFLLESLLNLIEYPSCQFLILAILQLKHFFLDLIVSNYGDSDDAYLNNVINISRTMKPHHILHLFHIMVTYRRPQKKDIILPISQPFASQESLNTTPEKSKKQAKNKYYLPAEFIFSNATKMRSLLRFKPCFLCGKVFKIIFIVVREVLTALGLFIFKTVCCCQAGKELRINETILPATHLKDAGVIFLRQDKPTNILDVTFEGNIMEIPQLRLYDPTNSILRNLIAFEQCFEDIGHDVSDYADFMDNLIDTPQDVAILQQNEIIYNRLGSNENVADLFNKICKGLFVSAKRSYLSELIKDVNKFCNKKRNKWRVKLNRDYFSSPWAIISVLAAAFLIVLTVLQTSFTIIAYFKPPK